jgi:osmotically inducible protein OsmC
MFCHRGRVPIEEEAMAQRTAEAEWQSSLQHSNGTLKLGSGAFAGNYSFASRFREQAERSSATARSRGRSPAPRSGFKVRLAAG